MEVVSSLEVFIDDDLKVPIEERIVVEKLVVVLINIDLDLRSDYCETINALKGM